MGKKAGLCSGLYRLAGGGNREGKRADWAKRVAFHLWATARWPSIQERRHRRRGRKELREEEGKAALMGGSSCAVRERTGGSSAMKAGRSSR